MPTPDPSAGPNTDLAQLVAAAADLCRKPLRHAVLPAPLRSGPGEALTADPATLPLSSDDCCLWLQVRSASGERLPEEDLELELFRSGDDLHLTVAWLEETERSMLWQGKHPVWMQPSSGERCERPAEGAPVEALARRLRALLSPESA